MAATATAEGTITGEGEATTTAQTATPSEATTCTEATTPAESTPSAIPTMRAPVEWDIRGVQNNWNWRVSRGGDDIAEEIEYQTRFPAKHLALVYRGVNASAPLLATIRITDGFDAFITSPSVTGSSPAAARASITMKDVANEPFTSHWPVSVLALGGRKLQWQYTHPVHYSDCIYLIDLVTGEVLGDGDNNYMALRKELPVEAVEELVITGIAAQIILADLMHNDRTIAAAGPAARDRW